MLDKELKFDRYENSFLWLKDADVALPVYHVDSPVIPLLASKSSNVFRLFPVILDYLQVHIQQKPKLN